MAIAFVAAGTVTEATAATITLARPTGVAVGDLMVACWNMDTNPTVTTPPTGWTLAAGPTNTAGATGNTGATYWKVANSADTTTANWAWVMSASNPHSGFILDFSGVDNATPMDATATTLANASSTNITATGLTTVTANAWLIWCGFENSGTFAITPPGGYTSRASGTTYRINAATAIQATPTALGNQVGTIGTARESVGQLLALRPAGAAPAGRPGRQPIRDRSQLAANYY